MTYRLVLFALLCTGETFRRAYNSADDKSCSAAVSFLRLPLPSALFTISVQGTGEMGTAGRTCCLNSLSALVNARIHFHDIAVRRRRRAVGNDR